MCIVKYKVLISIMLSIELAGMYRPNKSIVTIRHSFVPTASGNVSRQGLDYQMKTSIELTIEWCHVIEYCIAQ